MPTVVELDDTECVTITLIDANHCPGAVMYAYFAFLLSSCTSYTDMLPTPRFLIEGPRGNILHTGDFRAEPSFRNALSNNPHLSPYLTSKRARKAKQPALDAIYLDTASLLSTVDAPSKVRFPFSSVSTGILTFFDSRNAPPRIWST